MTVSQIVFNHFKLCCENWNPDPIFVGILDFDPVKMATNLFTTVKGGLANIPFFGGGGGAAAPAPPK